MNIISATFPAPPMDGCFMQILSQEAVMRSMFVDGELPQVGDVIEQVVVSIDAARGELRTKLRVVRATHDTREVKE